MNKDELANWQRIKDHMEAEDKTDNYFYSRACAIVSGNPDPVEPLSTIAEEED